MVSLEQDREVTFFLLSGVSIDRIATAMRWVAEQEEGTDNHLTFVARIRFQVKPHRSDKEIIVLRH